MGLGTWTLIVVMISPSALVFEAVPGKPAYVEPTAFITVNALPVFESEDDCENSDSVKFGKQYIDEGWTYLCLPTKLGLDPDILFDPNYQSRIIYLREKWAK